MDGHGTSKGRATRPADPRRLFGAYYRTCLVLYLPLFLVVAGYIVLQMFVQGPGWRVLLVRAQLIGDPFAGVFWLALSAFLFGVGQIVIWGPMSTLVARACALGGGANSEGAAAWTAIVSFLIFLVVFWVVAYATTYVALLCVLVLFVFLGSFGRKAGAERDMTPAVVEVEETPPPARIPSPMERAMEQAEAISQESEATMAAASLVLGHFEKLAAKYDREGSPEIAEAIRMKARKFKGDFLTGD